MVKYALIVLLIAGLVLGVMYLVQNPGTLANLLPSGSESSVLDLERNSNGGGQPGLGLNLNFGIGRNPGAVLAEAEAEQLRALIPTLIEEQVALNQHQRAILDATLPDAIQAGRTEQQVREDLMYLEQQVAAWKAENEREMVAAKLSARRTRNRVLALVGFGLATAIGVAALIYFPSRALKSTTRALFGPILQRMGNNTVVSSSAWDVLQGESDTPVVLPDFNPGVAFQLPRGEKPAARIGDEHPTASIASAAARVGHPQAVIQRLGDMASSLRRGERALPSSTEDR